MQRPPESFSLPMQQTESPLQRVQHFCGSGKSQPMEFPPMRDGSSGSVTSHPSSASR